MAVLALAAGLPDEAALDLLDGPPERLAVGDLRSTDVCVDVELALETVDDDLQVELAHAGDQRLARILVGTHAEGRILLREALEPGAELVLIRLRPRLDRD